MARIGKTVPPQSRGGRAQRGPGKLEQMSEWYSIEVFDGASSASLWAGVHGDPLVESALLMGAKDWTWHHHSWGVVLEIEFADTRSWDLWRAQPHVQASLDAVPDPVSGLIVYRGRGGSSGAPTPRKPRPLMGSGAAALPLPWDWDGDGFLPTLPRQWGPSVGAGSGPARPLLRSPRR